MKNKSKPTPERRFLTQEFRVAPEGEKPVIAGYAAVFDSQSEDLGGWTEVVDPHAFDAVMASNPDCRALWNHNADHVLGRVSAGTLSLSIDSRGLAYSIDPPDTQVARDLIVSMRRKDVTQSSFGFIVRRDQWTDLPDGSYQRRILEIDELLDVSPVCFPAYTSASSGVRSLPGTMPVEMRSKLEKRDNMAGCACDCPACIGDNCADCSNPDCVDMNCAHNQMSRSQDFNPERCRMEMQLALLAKL